MNKEQRFLVLQLNFRYVLTVVLLIGFTFLVSHVKKEVKWKIQILKLIKMN